MSFGVSKFHASKSDAKLNADYNYEQRVIQNAIRAANNALGVPMEGYEDKVNAASILGFALGGTGGMIIANDVIKSFAIDDDDINELMAYDMYDFLPEGYSLKFFNDEFADAQDDFRRGQIDIWNTGSAGPMEFGMDLLEAYVTSWAGAKAVGKSYGLDDFFASPISEGVDWWKENKPFESGAEWWKENKPFESIGHSWRERKFRPFQHMRLRNIWNQSGKNVGSGTPVSSSNIV